MHDTQAQNRKRQNLSTFDEIWVFGYGSLIHKVDFEYIERSCAYVYGWERRFWMLSHDHRGTAQKPGVVLTLTPSAHAKCFGIAYKITEKVFDHLDHREKNGYLREVTNIQLACGRRLKGLVYIGDVNSEVYLGPTNIETLSLQISKSIGPSGKNSDYVFSLANALRQYNVIDSHVFAIEDKLVTLSSLEK